MTPIPGTATPTKPQAAKPIQAPTRGLATQPVQVPGAQTRAKVKPVASQPLPLAKLPEHAPEFQVTTVKTTINAKKQNQTSIVQQEDIPWYMHQFSWMMFGTAIGLIFVLIGLRYPAFFYLGPVCPTVGIIAWYVRKFAIKFSGRVDAFPR